MAYIKKLDNGRWRVQIEKLGVRDSETFDKERDAKNWAARREAEILDGKAGKFPKKTLAEVLDIYALRVSSKKEGAHWETVRINAFKRHFPKLAGKVISETTAADWATWRDTRAAGIKAPLGGFKLKPASGSTIVREINLFSNVYQQAMHELGPYCGSSPFTKLTRPKENPARTRRWGWSETRRILRKLGYKTGRIPQTKSEEIAYAILVGLRTAMRIGETLSLSDENVDLAARVATVGHKMQYVTGEPRLVPMQKQAARLLGVLAGRGRYFSMSPSQVDGLWRKQRDKMLIEDLHIHDTRGEALTRLARRYDVLTLSRISGIKDLKMLMERYYRERADQIAARL